MNSPHPRLLIHQLLPLAACMLLAGAMFTGGRVQAEVLTSDAKVRLLFPILSGEELERLLPLVPEAVIVEVDGNTFVEVGRFGDARVAHRLGMSLQRRLALTFDLAYEHGHPQLGMAMAGELLPGVPPLDVAAGPAPASPPPTLRAARPTPTPPKAPAVAAVANPIDPEPVRAERIDTPLQTTLPPVALAPPQPVASPIATQASVNDIAPNDLSEVVREALQPVPLAASFSANDSTDDSAAPTPAPAELMGNHPWLRPVPIVAVAAGVPISRLPLALNPGLDYLYVQIRQSSDVDRLRQILPVQEMALQGEALLARVGVFTGSRQGRRLLAEKMERLRSNQLEPLLLAQTGPLETLG